MTDAALRNISDTARWVAVYRAIESERPDAWFHDPLAARLAGERGREIAKTMDFAHKNSWSFVARTVLFDRFVTSGVKQGADMVVNLAAGLDTRPYRMDLPADLPWIEVDLPELDQDEVTRLAEDLLQPGSFKAWALNMVSPRLMQMIQASNAQKNLSQAGAPLKFAPVEGPAFFSRLGWPPVEAERIDEPAEYRQTLSFQKSTVALKRT